MQNNHRFGNPGDEETKKKIPNVLEQIVSILSSDCNLSLGKEVYAGRQKSIRTSRTPSEAAACPRVNVNKSSSCLCKERRFTSECI